MCCQWGMTVHSQHGVMHCSFLGPSWQMLSKTAGSAARIGAGIWACVPGEDVICGWLVRVYTCQQARPGDHVMSCVNCQFKTRLPFYFEHNSPRRTSCSAACTHLPSICSWPFFFHQPTGVFCLCFLKDLLRNDLRCNRHPYKTDVGGHFKPSKINTLGMLSWNLADANQIVFVDMEFLCSIFIDSLDVLWVWEENWAIFSPFFGVETSENSFPPYICMLVLFKLHFYLCWDFFPLLLYLRICPEQ